MKILDGGEIIKKCKLLKIRCLEVLMNRNRNYFVAINLLHSLGWRNYCGFDFTSIDCDVYVLQADAYRLDLSHEYASRRKQISRMRMKKKVTNLTRKAVIRIH